MKGRIRVPRARRMMGALALLLCLLLPGSGWAAENGQQHGAAAGKIIRELEFRKTKVQDAVRVIAEMTGVNIVATSEAGKKEVSFFIRELPVEDIVDSICRISGLWYRYNSKSDTFIIMTTEEYQRDIVVFRNEPTRIFQLKYLNVAVAARTIADLFGDRVELEGKGNRHYGNDYLPGDARKNFLEDYDDGKADSDSTTTTTRYRTRERNRTRRVEATRSGRTADEEELSAAKLAMLEELQRSQDQIVAEATLDQLRSTKSEARIYVTINRLHNLILVRSSDEKALDEIARIIEESDQQVPEVLLELKVLEVQLRDGFESAFDIGNISGNQQIGPDDGRPINPFNNNARSVGSSALSSGNFGLVGNSTLVFQALSGNLRLRLQLLEEEGRISSIATPMLLAANNQPARLFVGQERVITTGFTTKSIDINEKVADVVRVTSVLVPVTEVRSVGDTLSILPSINADRSVVMRIVHENSSVAENSGRVPVVVGTNLDYASIDSINTATLEGTVLAQDGMTVAVGGMIRSNKRKTESKVPVLGDIPLLGFFFRDEELADTRTELILLITPHVLTAPDQGDAVTRQRIATLAHHPGELDEYFREQDQSRDALDRAKGLRPRGSLPPGPGTGAGAQEASGLEASFIELTRVAAKQVRMPILARLPEGDVRVVQLRDLGQLALFAEKELAARPVAAWTNGRHYITALRVSNRSEVKRVLDVGTLRGNWRAATLEAQQLAPAGETGDSTYLYLISDLRFEQNIQGGTAP